MERDGQGVVFGGRPWPGREVRRRRGRALWPSPVMPATGAVRPRPRVAETAAGQTGIAHPAPAGPGGRGEFSEFSEF